MDERDMYTDNGVGGEMGYVPSDDEPGVNTMFRRYMQENAADMNRQNMDEESDYDDEGISFDDIEEYEEAPMSSEDLLNEFYASQNTPRERLYSGNANKKKSSKRTEKKADKKAPKKMEAPVDDDETDFDQDDIFKQPKRKKEKPDKGEGKTGKTIIIALLGIVAIAIVGIGVAVAVLFSHPEKKLYGTWVAMIDFSEEVSGQLGPEYEGFQQPLYAKVCFEMNEDGQFKLYIDEATFAADVDTWIDAFVDYSLDKVYANQDIESLNAIFQEQYNMTLKDNVKSEVQKYVDVSAILNGASVSGVYKADKENIYFGQTQTSDNTYYTYKVSDTTLILETFQTDMLNVPGVINKNDIFELPFEFERAE